MRGIRMQKQAYDTSVVSPEELTQHERTQLVKAYELCYKLCKTVRSMTDTADRQALPSCRCMGV
jgi:hypothetical protein